MRSAESQWHDACAAVNEPGKSEEISSLLPFCRSPSSSSCARWNERSEYLIKSFAHLKQGVIFPSTFSLFVRSFFIATLCFLISTLFLEFWNLNHREGKKMLRDREASDINFYCIQLLFAAIIKTGKSEFGKRNQKVERNFYAVRRL